MVMSKNYIKNQFAQVREGDDHLDYQPNMKIAGPHGSTRWITISWANFAKIEAILTGEGENHEHE
jgi:hypothetical protein